MNKTIVITIIVDDVDIKNLSELAESVESLFEDYQDKRIDINLSDNPMIRPIPG